MRHESDNSDSPDRALSLLSLSSLNASGTKQQDFPTDNTMARKLNDDPIITFTEILSLAAQQLREGIDARRKDTERLTASAGGSTAMLEQYQKMAQDQENRDMARLDAIEDIYRITTGTELGISEELRG